MHSRAKINYRDFYDVPRIFIVHHRGMQLLFESSFDDAMDEYSDTYKVFLLPNISNDELHGSWISLPAKAIKCLGEVLIKEVAFDPSLRLEIEVGIIDRLLKGQAQQ